MFFYRWQVDIYYYYYLLVSIEHCNHLTMSRKGREGRGMMHYCFKFIVFCVPLRVIRGIRVIKSRASGSLPGQSCFKTVRCYCSFICMPKLMKLQTLLIFRAPEVQSGQFRGRARRHLFSVENIVVGDAKKTGEKQKAGSGGNFTKHPIWDFLDRGMMGAGGKVGRLVKRRRCERMRIYLELFRQTLLFAFAIFLSTWVF